MYNFVIISVFLVLVFHYLCTMGNQSIFYGYFQSWEWKEAWEDNNLRRMAGEHQNIIKSSLINFVFTMSLAVSIIYLLYHYKLLNFYSFDKIIWFRADKLYDYISNALVLPVYWYILLGFPFLFFSFMIYFLVYKFYPPYTDDNTPLYSRISLAYRKISIRDTLFIFIVMSLLVSYNFFHNIISPGITFIILLSLFILMFTSRIYWLLLSILIYILGITSYVYLMLKHSNLFISIIKLFSEFLKWIIPISLIGSILIILLSIGVVLWSWIFKRKNTDSVEYNELCKKMKPWLGFNNRFIMESFIEGKTYDFKELYELTNTKKKWLFWLEYFFANILNRNVSTLLQHKKLLWLKILFNLSDINYNKKVTPIGTFRYDNFPKKIKETLYTITKPKIEDPEGDVFTNLIIEEVENTKPSIWLPFYTTGIIYLNVIPYFIIYNTVMYIIFTKFVDIMIPMNLELLNVLLYGYTGVMIIIFLGFLLSIFANNMAVWLAWKKYYRLQQQGNQEAIFFSIFKQRVIYQYIYEYEKDEEGNVITVNYEDGLYPQFNLEKLDDIAKELSPRYYDLYSKKYPFYER